MKKPWVIFLVCIAAGITLLMFFTAQNHELSDTPTRTPTKSEIIPPGVSSLQLIKTSDESRISEMLLPTPIIRSATTKLLQTSCEFGTELCKLQAIYDFVRINYEYKPISPEHTYIQPPGETILYGSGDELELAMLMVSMQRAAGFENEILRGPYHTFVRTKLGNTTIMQDPSCQGCRFLDVRVQLSGTEDIFK